MKTSVVLITCMLSFFCFSANKTALADQFTLEQTVLAGLKANPSVQAARQVLEQARMNVKAARGSFLPSFTVQSSYSKYSLYGDVLTVDNLDRNIFTGNLAISQPLFAGYSILNNYLRAKIQVDADNARLGQARLDLIAHIQQDFLNLLKSREDLKTVNNEIERVESQLEASKVFYKAGLAPYNDVLKSEVELSKAQTDKIKVLNIIKNLTTQLNTYRSAPFDEDVQYVGDLHDYGFTLTYDVNSAITAALSKRPDLLIGKKSIEIAEKDAKETVARYYPRITLDYTIGRQQTDYDNYVISRATQDTATLGVNLKWNIFDGGTTTYSYLASLKHIAALKGSLENQIAEAKAAIVKAFTNIDDAKKLMELALNAKQSALENYNMATARYRTRIGTINEMFEAQTNLTRAESDISSAYMQYHVAKAALFNNIGIEDIALSGQCCSQ